jgi:hypothetical protein
LLESADTQENEEENFIENELNNLMEDRKIDGFADQMEAAWGSEESKLRMAVFVAFVNNHNTTIYRKKVKQQR